MIKYRCKIPRGLGKRRFLSSEKEILNEKEVLRMRDIVISIRNDFVADAVIGGLAESGEFQPIKLLFSRRDEVLCECDAVRPELLLCEVAFGRYTDMKTRLAEAREVKRRVPGCKIVFLCDENSAPELAGQVVQAKRDGRIDGFFYSSVGLEYLVAALTAM
jgi:DNA-binding NarL/FixJ family response regulator